MKIKNIVATTVIALGISLSIGHALDRDSGRSSSNSATFSEASGTNPFFPKRKKLTEPEKPRPITPDLFRVTALSISPDRGTVCTINGWQLEPGKEAMVRTAMGKLLIRCVEINSNAVVIALTNGFQFDLPLPRN